VRLQISCPEMQARSISLALKYEGLRGVAADKRLADVPDNDSRVIRATGMKELE
jgi:hypothetical protein